jgi:C-terminal processing protease CtpA/Prc
MRSFRLLFLVLMMAVLLVSCGQMTPAPAATPTPALSPKARVYLTAALDIMQQHSVKRKKINWTALRQQTFAFAFGAETPADTYPAINYALVALGDHHSSFFEPQDVKQLEAAALTPDEDPHGRRLAYGTGYLLLPHFLGTQAEKQYALLAQDVIGRVDQAGTCGWIVDLRNNSGEMCGPCWLGLVQSWVKE